MEQIIIEIHESEEGYMYDIFESEKDAEDGRSLDGGLCTGSMIDALGMAYAQAKEIIKKNQ